MRTFNLSSLKWDKRYIIAYVAAVFLGIISGIVLYKSNYLGGYFVNFADNYVYYVFIFKNGSLFLRHFLAELFYLYALFLICFCTKLKFLTVLIYFLRAFFVGVYCTILFTMFSVDGAVVALAVFIPSFFVSLVLSVAVCEQCRALSKPYCFALPLTLALISGLFFLLIINTLFRIVVVIV